MKISTQAKIDAYAMKCTYGIVPWKTHRSFLIIEMFLINKLKYCIYLIKKVKI